jgi:hypothetical protein
LNIPAQLGAIFFQLCYIFLQVPAIFTNVSARLMNISHVLTNFPSSRITRAVPYVMAKIPVTELAITPSVIVVSDEIAPARHLAAQYPAASRSRLLAWRSSWNPNPTHTGWGRVPRWYVIIAWLVPYLMAKMAIA